MNDSIEVASNSLIPIKSADQKHCFSCGNILHFSATQCPKCGAQQPAISVNSHISTEHTFSNAAGALTGQQAYCRGCGSVIHINAVSCPKCGAPQRANSQVYNNEIGRNKDKTTAGILGIFLGGFGVHKFYLGSIFLGFIYLLFFWTFIPALIGLIEGVYYLTLSDEEFARKYSSY